MKTSILLATLLALVLLTTIPASAQYGTKSAKGGTGWILRAGVFFPQGDTINSSEFTAGLEYEFPTTKASEKMSTAFSLSADYTRIKTRETVGTKDATLLPIFVNIKTKPGAVSSSGFDFGAGIGMYWAMDDIPDMRIDKGLQFAWQLIADYNFSKGYMVTARYLASKNPGDSGLFGLELGYRF